MTQAVLPQSLKRLTIHATVAALAVLLGACAGKSPEPASGDPSADVTNPNQRVTLVTPIPFAESAQVRDAVRNECRLQEKLARFIEQFSAERGIKVITTDESGGRIEGRKLEVAISAVYAPAGGAFSGGKAVTVKGKLTEGGRSLGSFKARRISGGGAFAMFKSTCDILGRDVETLGSDIAGFLASPEDGARMGNI